MFSIIPPHPVYICVSISINAFAFLILLHHFTPKNPAFQGFLVLIYVCRIFLMACNGANQPLLSGVVATPKTRKSNGDGPKKRRRLRRVQSAPLADFCPTDTNGEEALPRSESIFGRLNPSLKKVALVFTVYLGLGTLCFYTIRNQIRGDKTNGILDAVYFCVVTMTTVGYGDLVPNSDLAKLLACAFVFTGMALIGLVLSKAADYLAEKQEILLVKALYMYQKVGELEVLKEIENKRVQYKFYTTLILLVVLILTGTIFLHKVENLDLIDAFYCVCSTTTTLGYGDKSFSTEGGRIFAVFWILASTICLAQFFLYIAEVNTENRQRALVKWVLTRKTTNVDLEAADIDDDGVVGAAEFVLFKLKEMGKICQNDISLILEEFEDLDVDQSGTLSISDITEAQSVASVSVELSEVILMPDHFYSIDSMTSNDEKQGMLTNDEHAPEKISFRGCKTTLVAAKCAPPDTLRSEIPDLKWLGIYFGVYLTIGTISFYSIKDDIGGKKTNDFVDSLYYCITTMTTVGNGDLSPHSFDAQVLSAIFVIVGMFLFGIAVKIAAKYLVVKQQMVMVNALRTARKIGPVEALKEIDSLKIDYLKIKISLIVMGVHFVLGIFVLLTVEGQDFFDCVYCAVTTMTTTGYGEQSFQSTFGRMFAAFWISTGTSCVCQLFLYFAEVYTDVETRKLAKRVIASNIAAKKDLEAAVDTEDHKAYGAKKPGKMKQDDVSVAMKDVDDVSSPAKPAQEK
ncbi:hypothetical protein V6N13_129427 [Hibiscus sabdariffa]|uniref:Potassium channel domain-containing protein n=1 Tax=Hibiscus sabdariffa TaxID=183260 RepID=A0ABR2SL61_9ROSI